MNKDEGKTNSTINDSHIKPLFKDETLNSINQSIKIQSKEIKQLNPIKDIKQLQR